MVLDHLTTRAHAEHGKPWSDFISDWWRSSRPPVQRPVRRRPPVRLA